MESPKRREGVAKVQNQDVPTKPFRTYLNRAGAGNREGILFLHGSGAGCLGLVQLATCSASFRGHF